MPLNRANYSYLQPPDPDDDEEDDDYEADDAL